jgi:signal transduction histidine kinase
VGGIGNAGSLPTEENGAKFYLMETSLHTSTEALIHLDALAGEEWEAALQEILRVDSNVLGVECVSYWRFRLSSIVCELGYHQSIKGFDRGLELRGTDAPAYFEEIRRTPVLVIEDALRDPRSRDLEAYLSSRHIGALLDTAVRVSGDVVGILCHEHVGGPRHWSEQEQHIAFAIGQIIGGRIATRAHSRTQERERKAALLADVMTNVAEAFGSSAAAQVAVDRAVPTLGDFCVLVVVEGAEVSDMAAAHIHPEGLVRLQNLLRRYPPSLKGPGFASHALREQESLLVPDVDDAAARYYGFEGDHLKHITALGVRSAMAAPFCVRGVMRGTMVCGSSFLRYDQEDLKFAEAYAQRVGLILENGRLYRRAEEAIKARDEFLSLASHELRTPLTSLSLFAQSIVREAAAQPEGPLTSLGQGMVRQADRLDRLAGRLLSASEIGVDAPTIHRESLDLSELVRDLTLAFSGVAGAAGSTVVASVDDHLIGNFDGTRMEQVVGNLIDNAVKFGTGSPIEVALHAHDGTAILSVRDYGPGIPLEEQGELFQRYRRGSAAAGLGGLGLGLHLVREIVEAHGGAVRVDACPGKGSTFTVELPLDRA